jgi:urease gamma subunit
VDAVSVLASIENSLGGIPAPNAEALKAIRKTFDDPAFLRALREYIRTLNDPDAVAAIRERVLKVSRDCGDLSETRRVHSEIGIRVGVTSGVGLMISSIVAAVAAAVPLIGLITVFGGGWMTAVGYYYGTKLNEEAKIYKDIAERTAKILESIDVP